MPYTGMLVSGMGVFEEHYSASKPPRHVKRNMKKSKMARASRRNNRKR